MSIMKLSFLDLAGISHYQVLELVGEFDLVTFLMLLSFCYDSRTLFFFFFSSLFPWVAFAIHWLLFSYASWLKQLIVADTALAHDGGLLG